MADPEPTLSADSTVTLEEFDADPFYHSDRAQEPAPVWQHSDYIARLLKERNPDAAGLKALLDALQRQLPTLLLYRQVVELLKGLSKPGGASKKLSFYVLLFPGEAKDNTGIKDLNDKVLGYKQCTRYIRLRQEAIEGLYGKPGDKFFVVGQNFKVAYIATLELTRKDFVSRLKELDAKLRDILLNDVLPAAEREADELDDEAKRKRLDAIAKLRKALKPKDYRFDVFFGFVTRGLTRTVIDTVYLLLTEALKGAALGRLATKGGTLKHDAPKKFVGVKLDAAVLDPRGKEFDWRTFILASEKAVLLKEFVSKPQYDGGSFPSDYYNILVDNVWAVAFLEEALRLFGNPDVIRDVRKKLLVKPPAKRGIKFRFYEQKELLELWLVILNMLDLVKDFLIGEMRNELAAYHDTGLALDKQLNDARADPDAGKRIEWNKLTNFLTQDLRKVDITIAGTASEYRFYTYASDHTDLIFFSMDVRDMGVDLMLWYEAANGEIDYLRPQDVPLMEETIEASDPINEQKRLTYTAVDTTFELYATLIDQIHKGTVQERQGKVMPPFENRAEWKWVTVVDAMRGAFGYLPAYPTTPTYHVMLGGDEVFVAADPRFAAFVTEIIALLDQPADGDSLNLRAAVSYSKADRDRNPQKQRRLNQESHDQAIGRANDGAGPLKKFERTHRRIERLIEKLERNEKKKHLAPKYWQALEQLGLMKLYCRVSHGNPRVLSTPFYFKLRRLLQAGSAEGARKGTGVNVELIDFRGNVVDEKKLVATAEKLEQSVCLDVGLDDYHIDAPPINIKIPKIIEKVLDKYFPKDGERRKKKGKAPGGVDDRKKA